MSFSYRKGTLLQRKGDNVLCVIKSINNDIYTLVTYLGEKFVGEYVTYELVDNYEVVRW